MARRGGLSVDPYDEVEDKVEEALVSDAIATGSRELDLDVDVVAPDPDNPEGRLKPKRRIIDGIKARGQLQTGMVQPVERWIAQGGDPSRLRQPKDKNKKIEYVIVFGHGRWAACTELGKTFRAVVNTTIEDLTDHIIDQLQENLNREDLDPIQEALGYQRLVARKLSQHKIAAKIGVPQPHISKRLKLLGLPPEAQAAVSNKTMLIEPALKLVKIAEAAKGKSGSDAARLQNVLETLQELTPADTDRDEDDATDQRLATRQEAAKNAVDAAYSGYEMDKAKQEKRDELVKVGFIVIDDPADFFKGRQYRPQRYELHTAEEIETARKDGTAVARVYSRDRVDWYTTKDPVPADVPAPREPATQTDTDAQPDHEANGVVTPNTAAAANRSRTVQKQADAEAARLAAAEQERERLEREQNEHERTKAREARDAACARIAAKAPPRDALTTRLTRRMLVEDPFYFAADAQPLALAWLQAAKILDSSWTTDMLFDGADDIGQLDDKVKTRIAYIYDLAFDEARLREYDAADWDDFDVAHLKRLESEGGHHLSEWEQSRVLAAASTDKD